MGGWGKMAIPSLKNTISITMTSVIFCNAKNWTVLEICIVQHGEAMLWTSSLFNFPKLNIFAGICIWVQMPLYGAIWPLPRTLKPPSEIDIQMN